MEERYVEVPVVPRPKRDWVGAPAAVPTGTPGPTTAAAEDGNRRRVTIRYVTEGKGPAVILVHGLGASLAAWRENIHYLAEEYAVYALDMPGHGESDKPADLDYDPVSGAHFLVSFMDTMDISRATLIGNSAGGLVTAICSLAYPHRVERLVLVNPAGLGRQLPWFLRFSSLPILGKLLHIPNVLNSRNMMKSIFYEPKPIVDDVAQELMKVRNLPDTKMAVLKAVRSSVNLLGLRKHLRILPELKDMTIPMLIVWGREDRIVPVSHAYRAAEVLHRDVVHVFPHCGHWPQMEKATEFNPLVVRFLSGGLDSKQEAT